MDKKTYERKINDIIMKCPIEAGVEILVYSLLDEFIDSKKLSLVDINRIRKNKDPRLTTSAGIPDIAVLSNDFQFGDTNKGEVYGFIEVKVTGEKLNETEQISGQMEDIKHYFYTNGLVWKYYKNQMIRETIFLAQKEDENELDHRSIFEPLTIKEEKYNELIRLLKGIDWTGG
ncbi:MAG: hypothetical protein GXY43_04625 [Clostridiaceae bacterium]|nr:hypothetical protein [Clostridiaceae bacterium]